MFSRPTRRALGVLVTAAALCSPLAAFAQDPASAPGAAPLTLPSAVAPAPGGAIPAGTTVIVRLAQSLRSGRDKAGEAVRFTVAFPVRAAVDGPVLIPADTPGVGTVVESRGAGAFGRPGRLSVRCDALTLADGRRVPLQAGGGALSGSGSNRAGAAGATGAVVGIGTGVGVGIAISLSDLFTTHRNSGDARPYLAGAAAALLVSAVWRGGDVTLPVGKQFTETVGTGQAAP